MTQSGFLSFGMGLALCGAAMTFEKDSPLALDPGKKDELWKLVSAQ